MLAPERRETITKQEKRTDSEVLDEEKNVELADDLLEGVSGGARHRHKPKIPRKPSKNAATDPDNDDSGGATGSWQEVAVPRRKSHDTDDEGECGHGPHSLTLGATMPLGFAPMPLSALPCGWPWQPSSLNARSVTRHGWGMRLGVALSVSKNGHATREQEAEDTFAQVDDV